MGGRSSGEEKIRRLATGAVAVAVWMMLESRQTAQPSDVRNKSTHCIKKALLMLVLSCRRVCRTLAQKLSRTPPPSRRACMHDAAPRPRDSERSRPIEPRSAEMGGQESLRIRSVPPLVPRPLSLSPSSNLIKHHRLQAYIVASQFISPLYVIVVIPGRFGVSLGRLLGSAARSSLHTSGT